MTWFHNQDRTCAQLLFLNGIAGIGKSTVASTVCLLVDGNGELGGSHFFSRINGRTNPANVFTSLAFQLAKRDQILKKEIAGALEKDLDAGRGEIKNQLLTLIVGPLSRLPNPPSRLLLVIDALDECSVADSGELLIPLLFHLPTIPFVKVLITGRPEQHITSALIPRPGLQLQAVVMHNIEQHIMEKDVEIYLRASFAELQERLRRRGIEWRWTEGQLKTLVKRSGKLFVYAVTVYKYISNPKLADPEEQIKIILDAETPPNSLSPYADLDALYLQLLKIVLPLTDRDGRLIDRFQEVIGSIVTLIEPLPLASLTRFITTKEGHIQLMLEAMTSVISAPENSQGIPEVYHPSFPDFITDPTRCRDEQLIIVSHQAHARLASSCLQLMITHLKRDICNIKDPSKLNDEVAGLENRVQDAIPSWLRYACVHWGQHISKASVGNLQVKEHLEKFCRHRVMHWLEALSLLGRLEKGADFLEGVRKWAVSIYLCFANFSLIFCHHSRNLLVAQTQCWVY